LSSPASRIRLTGRLSQFLPDPPSQTMRHCVAIFATRYIKVIKRMAYGYRDSDYFFLKIKAAFPGNPR
ncbi:MAG: hypothetical protein U9Q93_07460, partial [Pseudomonadota bacterium]|nr:hypothetical protein [Pseudomonadota bacterium]